MDVNDWCLYILSIYSYKAAYIDPKGPFKATRWHHPQKSLGQSLTYAELSTSSPKTKADDTVSVSTHFIFLSFEYSLHWVNAHFSTIFALQKQEHRWRGPPSDLCWWTTRDKH